MTEKKIEDRHISVMLDELVESIEIFDKRNIVVDCTLGMWWHAEQVIKKMWLGDIFVWFDADKQNLELAKKRLSKLNSEVELKFINSNFVNLKQKLKEIGIEKITWIYYDLWISSLHVDEADRWFSFKLDWPLDMRFDKSSWKKASEIVNFYSEVELKEIFQNYWEEPKSKTIAKAIVEKRKNKKFETTAELSDLIKTVSKDHKSKNRVFQAIRIETNSELENAEKSISHAIELLETWWKIFVISFHSLEDRLVKNIFRKESKDCLCTDIICSCKHKKQIKIISKKPILPTEEEIKENQRSRSAKARLAEKI